MHGRSDTRTMERNSWRLEESVLKSTRRMLNSTWYVFFMSTIFFCDITKYWISLFGANSSTLFPFHSLHFLVLLTKLSFSSNLLCIARPSAAVVNRVIRIRVVVIIICRGVKNVDKNYTAVLTVLLKMHKVISVFSSVRNIKLVFY